AGEADRVAEQVVEIDAALVGEVGRSLGLAGRGGEDGPVELAGEKVCDHRLLEEGGTLGEVLHVAEEVAELLRARPPHQDGLLVDGEEVELAGFVLRLDTAFALRAAAVDELPAGLIDAAIDGAI